MHVTLGQIRAFVTVASTGNFTRAADVLHLSQPALTNRVRQFEEALGLRLFDRHTHAVELTALGHDMLPLFRRLIAEFDTAVARARESVNRTKSLIRLACLPSCAATLLPDLIRDFTHEEPGVSFVVRDVINNLVAGLVRSSQVDFGIAVRDEQHSDLEWQPLFSDSLHVVYGSEDPGFETDTVTACSLASRPLILMVPGSSVREKVDEAFATAGFTALAACEVNHMSTAVALVRASLGITILPSTAAEIKLQTEIRSRPIRAPGFSRDIALVRRKGSTLHPSAEGFIELLVRKLATRV